MLHYRFFILFAAISIITLGLTSGCPTTPVDCTSDADCPDDGNACTTELCDTAMGSCFTVNNTDACDDFNTCTQADMCSGGTCGGTLIAGCCNTDADCATGKSCVNNMCQGPGVVRIVCTLDGECDDGNDCTDDACVNSSCSHRNNTATCDDRRTCTVNDVCRNGVCEGTAVDCSDTDACTIDFCDPATGICFNTPINCPPGQTCHQATGMCAIGTGCTTDADCPDDGLFCTGTETCSGGQCQSGSNPCATDQLCNESANRCDDCQNNSHCDDGLFCNGAETCSGGQCQSGSNPCATDHLCNESTDRCDGCTSDDDCQDGQTCDPIAGTCVSDSCPEGSVLIDGECAPVEPLGLDFFGAYDQIPLAIPPSSGALPVSVDLSSDMPTPGDQGQQASCVGWAIGYGLKTYQERIERGWSLSDPAHVFSPAFIYNQINQCPNSCRCGTFMASALNILSSVGCASLSTFPYDDDVCDDAPTSSHLQEALEFRIESWKRVNLLDLTEVKEFLNARQPVVIGFRVFSSFDALRNEGPNAIYDHISGAERGGHAVVLVGYDDTKQRFKAMNSWGSTWGDAGYFYLTYSLWATVVREGYVAVDVFPPCTGNDDCDDGLFCNGAETCSAGDCQPGQSPCPDGFLCNEQTDQCGIVSALEWIYFTDSDTDSIRRVRADGTGLFDLVTGQEAPYGIGIDTSAGKVYWTDLNADAVRRANLDGSGVQTLVLNTSLFNSPTGLALDPSGNRIYWLANNTSVTPNQQAIFQASLSGGSPGPVVNGLGGNPIGLAIDIVNQRLYWTNQGSLGGSDGSLWRVNLSDGSTAPVLITGVTLRDPRGIALDVANGRIYWTDILAGAGIYSAPIGGGTGNLLCSDAGSLNGVALDLSARRVYWTNQSDGTIRVGNIDGACNPSDVVSGLGTPWAIALDSD